MPDNPAAARSARAPYFAFETHLKPVPAQPTHCRCGAELEPLRRYAGLCQRCVAGQSKSAKAVPTAHLISRMVVVRELSRQRPGHRERYVEVQCECGQRRVLKWSTWAHKRPLCCNQCRLQGIDKRGFEAEFAR